jgi:cobalt-zinc-cadmium efflux system protein
MATDRPRPGGNNNQAAGTAGRNSMFLALMLTIGLMVYEVIGGWASDSLALLAAAGLLLATGSAITIAGFSAWAESRPASVERTFGYHRVEVAGAMLGSLALWLVAAWVLFESIDRLQNRSELEVNGGLMLIVGIIAAGGNILAALVLKLGSRGNRRADEAFWHLVSDFLGSIGVVAAAVLVHYNGWTVADPIVAIGVAALIAASSWRLILKVFYAIMEGTPEHLDLYSLCADIEGVPGVTLIHDVHAWSISEGYHAFTAHVVVEPGHTASSEELLEEMRRIVYEKHRVSHITLQFEESATQCLEDHHLGHLEATSRFDRLAG